MGCFAYSLSCSTITFNLHRKSFVETQKFLPWGRPFMKTLVDYKCGRGDFRPLLVVSNLMNFGKAETNEEEKENMRFRWENIGSDITEEQKEAIFQLPPKMPNRCKALMKQIICYSAEKGSLSVMLAMWVKSMKPRRADWLVVLKELRKLDHQLYLEVAELVLVEDTFEANVRDYTNIIHGYAKQSRLQKAESALTAMKERGFICDQVTLTALVHMYSKAGNLKLAQDTFEEMKLLGVQLDKRSYGSMIMAYVRAGMLNQVDSLLRQMEAEEVCAGREVYKALLRAYSMNGDYEGAQRTFDSIQLAGIPPDPKVCALLINAYVVAGQSREARVAFDNLKRAGLEPNDKCVALILSVYEKEHKLNEALEFLMVLERDGIVLGKEASEILVGWFRRLGVVKEVEAVLRDYASTIA